MLFFYPNISHVHFVYVHQASELLGFVLLLSILIGRAHSICINIAVDVRGT